jgi:hypothetical protein
VSNLILAESLASTVRFFCPDEATAAALSYIAADPDMKRERRRFVDYPIHALGQGLYDFALPRSNPAGTASQMVERAHVALRRVIAEETAGDPVVHAGSMLFNQRRIVVVGHKGSGKTTLLAKCLSEGIVVEADEHVAVQGLQVMGRPRTMRVKETSVGLIPELRDAICSSPFLHDWNGTRIYSFAPRTPSVKWEIASGPAHFLLFLRPNHGGESSVEPLCQTDAFAALLRNVQLPETGKGAALARLHQLLPRAKCLNLRIGDLDGALRHLQRLSQSC